MLYTRQPLTPCHKPLLFYLVLQSNMRLTGRSLRRRGFRLHRRGNLRYWHRPAGRAAGGSERLPHAPDYSQCLVTE